MNRSIFKAYDIRGVYPKEIDEKAVFEIAISLAKFFKFGKIFVGRDTRLSSPALYKAVLAGFQAAKMKMQVVSVGVVTTPMLYFLVNKLKGRGGVMVTASHNPPEYNGLKVVGKKAKMISGKEILKNNV